MLNKHTMQSSVQTVLICPLENTESHRLSQITF